MAKSTIHITRSNVSCGVKQFYYICNDDVDDQLFDAAEQIYNKSRYEPDKKLGRTIHIPGGIEGDVNRPWVGNCAFFVFSHNGGGYDACKAIMDRVHELKLGDCWASEPSRNPNSGNQIIVYVWRIDQSAFRKWWSARKEKTAEKKAEAKKASSEPWTVTDISEQAVESRAAGR